MTPLEVAAVAHAALGGVFVLVATAAFTARPKPRGPAGVLPSPPVVLLRPVEVADEAFAERISSDARAYAGPLTRVVCVGSPAATASASLDGLRARGARVVLHEIADDAPINRKARHLAAALADAQRAGLVTRDTVVVHADADVVLREGDVDALVATLGCDAPDGASFASPSPRGGDPLAELAVRAIVCASPQAFAVLWSLARMTGAPAAMAGKLVALRAGTLAAIGGYSSMAPFIADDVALVDALHAQGRPVALAPIAATTVAQTRALGDVVAQMTRWLAVASAHRPGLLAVYPLLVAPAVLTSALALACVATGHAVTAASALALLVVPRILLALVLAAGHYAEPKATGALAVARVARLTAGIFLGDAVLTLAAMRALRGHPIPWAGRVYDLEPSGRGRIRAVYPPGLPRPLTSRPHR